MIMWEMICPPTSRKMIARLIPRENPKLTPLMTDQPIKLRRWEIRPVSVLSSIPCLLFEQALLRLLSRVCGIWGINWYLFRNLKTTLYSRIGHLVLEALISKWRIAYIFVDYTPVRRSPSISVWMSISSRSGSNRRGWSWCRCRLLFWGYSKLVKGTAIHPISSPTNCYSVVTI